MAFEKEHEWLKQVCGENDTLAPELANELHDFEQRQSFIDATLKTAEFDKIKSDLKTHLSDMDFVVMTYDKNIESTMSLNPAAGLVWKKMGIKTPKRIQVLANVGDKKIPVEIENAEWDSYADRAGEFKKLKKGDEEFAFSSPEAAAAIREMYAKLEPLIEKSNDLAKLQGKDGKRLFSDRDIEKELWTPLVREGVIPSNLVPDSFSEGLNVFSNATAIYTRLMAEEEGQEMGGSKLGSGLRNAKLLIGAANLASSQALDYANLSITEASRDDIAEFMKFKGADVIEGNVVPYDEMPDEYDDLVIDGKTIAEIKKMDEEDRPKISQSDLTEARYAKAHPEGATSYKDWLSQEEETLVAQMETEKDEEKLIQLRNELDGVSVEQNKLEYANLEIKDGMTLSELADDEAKVTQLQLTQAQFDKFKEDGGKGDYDDWLAGEEKRILAEMETASVTEKAELERELGNIKAAKMTQAYGEYVRQDAARKCAVAAALGAVEAVEGARDKKKKKREVAIGLAGAMADAFAAGMTAGSTAKDLTSDADTQNREHKTKFGILAGKAGLKAVSKLSELAEAKAKGTLRDPRELVVEAVADLCDAAGESMSASGTKGEDGGWGDTGKDSRDEAASWGMLAKAIGMSTQMIDKMVAAAQKGDWDTFVKELALLPVAASFAGTAGLQGDAVRVDKDARDIEAGWGGHGSDSPFATNPFEEEAHAGGQTDFGMSGNMATVADQRGVMDEARELSQQIADESFMTDRVKVKKAMDKCRAMVKKYKLPEDQKDVKLFLSLDPDKADPTAVMGALKKLGEIYDSMVSQDARDVAELNLSPEDEKALDDKLDSMIDKIDEIEKRPTRNNNKLEAEVRVLYDDVTATLLKDPKFVASVEADIDEEDEWLEKLKKQADLTRLDQYSDPKIYAEEYERAMSAVEELTLQVKKTDQRIKMIDQATKGATGILLAAMPGAALLGKIRTLIADSIKLHRRRKSLNKWSREMNAIRGSYSPYEPAVVGERDVLIAGTAHDAAQVAADSAGVGAEIARLTDATHIGAAVLTSIEKIGKFLNSYWFGKHGREQIQKGWELFVLAREQPKNRRLAREAIKVNTTLGKCVLAYGACIDGDAQARRALQSCGLTPEAFEDSADVCQGVVAYLRAALQDKEFETIGSHADVDWLPCDVEPDVKAWSRIKASAVKSKPGMDSRYFKTPEINKLLENYVVPDDSADHAILSRFAKRTKKLSEALNSYRPLDTELNPHAAMIVVAQELKHQVDVAGDQAAKRLAKERTS
ncbi:hypothetical protein [Ruegeria lacuscaerulensis]|uniref:hypothetical protein n=1 Tax=Ruegeria lacuscaerulensis TaxID=55218 RepID=UPI00147B8190|nr:hypothetical protein [Ruegeria lacuscaerulensis]